MEGREELDLALKLGHQPLELYYSLAYITKEEVSSFTLGDHCQPVVLSKSLFDAIAYQKVPGNYMAVFPAFEHALDDLNEHELCVVLEKVEKPGNLGAILRTCDALGVGKLILTETEIDLFNPNVIRNSRGAVFTVSCSISTNQELKSMFQKAGRKSIATALTPSAIPYQQSQRVTPCALIFGSESLGLSDFWLEHADETVIIPMRGQVDSLNVSVSVGILASHWLMG